MTVKATTIDGTNVTATRQITIAAIREQKEQVFYTIRFLNWDGSLLQTTSVPENTVPTYNGATPTRPDDEQFTYTFTGWVPALVAATADATYTATYSAQQKQEGLTQIDEAGTPEKVLINGVIYIRRGDKIFTVTGQETK